MNLTQNEIDVLKAIDESEYGEHLTDPIWTFSIADNCKLKKTSIPGVCASLSVKGMIECQGYGKDSTVCMTEFGAHEYIKINTPQKVMLKEMNEAKHTPTPESTN